MINKDRLVFLFISMLLTTSYLSAQTRAVKINALKTNDYGTRYMLPKTMLKVNIEYVEIQQKAGLYAKYASRYLGINESDVIMEDQNYYKLSNVSITETSIPDKEYTYLILFRAKTISPFVYLTEDGVICTINAEYIPEPASGKQIVEETAFDLSPIQPQSVYTEEYLRAGSTSKMAEVAAKNIYKIRESRQDILTGEAENVPKDGEAMKIILSNLEMQEKLWMELFIGSGKTIKHHQELTIEPNREMNKEILFRFSKYFGVTNIDDLSGNPVYIYLKDLKTVKADETDLKRKTKDEESIVYNVPGKAEIEIYNGLKKIYSTIVNVTQFGTTQILASSLLDDKKMPVQIYFYPATGAIKQIIQ
jgi:hypothetical protein